jgi:voltage-gated potassium channel
MPSLGRRLLTGFLVLVAVVVGGAAGYYVIGEGRWAFRECIYMTVITVTTVGYGETLPGMDVTPYARGFTMLLLIFGTGSIVFFASMITAFVVEGELRDVLFQSRLKKRMKRMKDHVVVCGAGTTGRHVIEELLATKIPVVAVDLNEHELKEIADKFPKADFAYIPGDATDDDIIAQANLAGARGLVSALASDKDNLYMVVSARQTNPALRIIARCAEVTHIDKIKKAGADSVVSPNAIGAMRLVSEMVRPAVVSFLDTMLRDKRAPYRIEEVKLRADAAEVGKQLGDARMHERFGMGVIALRATEHQPWMYNPAPDEQLTAGMTLVVLGSPDQVAKLRAELA